MPRGRLIALEGGEGSGKSTQAERLAARLTLAGIPAVLTREPGSTPLGNHLRNYLKSKQPICPESEAMLFAAARAQMVQDIIRPNIEKGMTVVSDRFEASTAAYQGYGRKGDLGFIEILNGKATGGISAELTILLDLEPEKGLERAGKPQLRLSLDPQEEADRARLDAEGHRRFEDLTIGFHRRVRKGYRLLAGSRPGWAVVDAARSEEEVAEEIWGAVVRACGLWK